MKIRAGQAGEPHRAGDHRLRQRPVDVVKDDLSTRQMQRGCAKAQAGYSSKTPCLSTIPFPSSSMIISIFSLSLSNKILACVVPYS